MKRYVISLGTACSIIALAFISGLPLWVKILIVLVGILCLIILCYDAKMENEVNQIVCTSDTEIREAMMRIIKSQGKICIMSRDISWATEEIIDCMKRKKDVLIFAQHETELTKKISDCGIQIKYYGKTGFEPKTRFTIIGYNRNNFQVAIGDPNRSIRKKKNGKHIIYETSLDTNSQDKWINSLAFDMMNLCNAVSEEEKRC